MKVVILTASHGASGYDWVVVAVQANECEWRLAFFTYGDVGEGAATHSGNASRIWKPEAKLFTQGVWQAAIVAKALEGLSIFHSKTLAGHLFHCL